MWKRLNTCVPEKEAFMTSSFTVTTLYLSPWRFSPLTLQRVNSGSKPRPTRIPALEPPSSRWPAGGARPPPVGPRRAAWRRSEKSPPKGASFSCRCCYSRSSSKTCKWARAPSDSAGVERAHPAHTGSKATEPLLKILRPGRMPSCIQPTSHWSPRLATGAGDMGLASALPAVPEGKDEGGQRPDLALPALAPHRVQPRAGWRVAQGAGGAEHVWTDVS